VCVCVSVRHYQNILSVLSAFVNCLHFPAKQRDVYFLGIKLTSATKKVPTTTSGRMTLICRVRHFHCGAFLAIVYSRGSSFSVSANSAPPHAVIDFTGSSRLAEEHEMCAGQRDVGGRRHCPVLTSLSTARLISSSHPILLPATQPGHSSVM